MFRYYLMFMKYPRKFGYVWKKTESPKYLRKNPNTLNYPWKNLKTTWTGYMNYCSMFFENKYKVLICVVWKLLKCAHINININSKCNNCSFILPLLVICSLLITRDSWPGARRSNLLQIIYYMWESLKVPFKMRK